VKDNRSSVRTSCDAACHAAGGGGRKKMPIHVNISDVTLMGTSIRACTDNLEVIPIRIIEKQVEPNADIQMKGGSIAVYA